MQALYFWKDWPTSYRWLWYTFLTFFVFSLVLLWYSYFQGAAGVIDWNKHEEQKVVETSVHNFNLGPFQLSVPGESYVIIEYLQGSDLHHNMATSYIFMTLFTLCIVLLLTVITTLDRFWYLFGMGLFIVLIASLRFDVLQIFGVKGMTVPVVIIAVYLVLSYYFKSFNTGIPFLSRFFSFLAVTIVLLVCILFFSNAEYPIIHLTTTAYPAALIISVLFIITVAHELVASFVYITNQQSGSGVKHFVIISLIYLVNVIIAALYEMRIIDWDFIYINVYLLLSFSAVLGLWGFRLRESLYENIFPFSPFGGFFFISIGTICLITIAQLLGNWNDAALKIVRDLILFSHAGFGIIFLTYFLSNFVAMMAENKPVVRVLYKPNRMPYFTFRFAGLIAMLAFVFYSNWRTYIYHGIGGFYNYVADLYMLQGDETFARSFYEQSDHQTPLNNRANYALATYHTARYNFDEAFKNYDYANERRPIEFSLVNEGNLFLRTGRYFDAIHELRRAEFHAPNSAALLNNLGYAYSKIHRVDSASYYFEKARNHKLTQHSAEANFFALAALEYLPIKTDSLAKVFGNNSPMVKANALALATLFDQPIETDFEIDELHGKQLDLYSATELNNYLINQAKKLDTTFTRKAFDIASDTLNADYGEALKASLAHAYYHQGNVYKALEIMGELAYLSSSHKGKYNYIMGLWTLEQENPEIAASFFSHAETTNYKQAPFYYAIALTESGQYTQAIIAWDSVARGDDDAQKQLAMQLKKILTLQPAEVTGLPDNEKYQYCRYRIGLNDTTLLNRIANTFEDVNYKAQALLDMTRKQFKAGRTGAAIQLLNKVSGLQLTDKNLFDNIRFTELQLLASRKEIRTLAAQINKGVTFDEQHNLEKVLYATLMSEVSGDTVTASKNYEFLAKQNPYFEIGILAAAQYFGSHDRSGLRAYNTLVEAIHVNPNSIPLLRAYIQEASKQGFEEFAASAAERLALLEGRYAQ
jgi:tetratricopeptide (TPR) repeat protein